EGIDELWLNRIAGNGAGWFGCLWPAQAIRCEPCRRGDNDTQTEQTGLRRGTGQPAGTGRGNGGGQPGPGRIAESLRAGGSAGPGLPERTGAGRGKSAVAGQGRTSAGGGTFRPGRAGNRLSMTALAQ